MAFFLRHSGVKCAPALNPKSVCKALLDDGYLVTDGGRYQKTLRDARRGHEALHCFLYHFAW